MGDTAGGQLPGLNLCALRCWLDAEHPGFAAGPLSAELIAGGRSNLTYALTDGIGRWVLRRPPLGHVLATAHDMVREHRVVSALAPTAVPVPRALALCEDQGVIGAPFYLMEQVRGTVLRTLEQTLALGRERARELSGQLMGVLADLHSVDPAEVGLADFGRPDGYLKRQLVRWGRQLDASRSRGLPGLDELHSRLGDTVPETQRHTVVHGDYRLDNAIVDQEARIAAVLDWEMATLGDPLADLGLFLVYWDVTREVLPDNPIARGVSDRAGFPRGAEIVRPYAERTGLDLTPLPWYVAFGCFKLAVIAEGIHYRYTQGLTVGRGFGRIGDLVAPLAGHGLRVLTAAPVKPPAPARSPAPAASPVSPATADPDPDLAEG